MPRPRLGFCFRLASEQGCDRSYRLFYGSVDPTRPLSVCVPEKGQSPLAK
jgi:hypothetical protein